MKTCGHDSVLFMLHCAEGTGYAIAPLEEVFFAAAVRAGFGPERIYFAYSRLSPSKHELSPKGLLEENRIAFDYIAFEKGRVNELKEYIRARRIRLVVAFDLQVENPLSRILRDAGVRRIVSYWGAPISSLNQGLKLRLKRIEVGLRFWRPDVFVFESEAMVRTALGGRGLRDCEVRLVRLGVDTIRFSRASVPRSYAHDQFGIPADRSIVFYSGHMEPRKGVHVILLAAKYLVETLHRRDLHFLFCGNRGTEHEQFSTLYSGGAAGHYITFGGYRSDIEKLMGSADIGVIASTGWDSFTMSSIEMAASGLPLVVSNLQGLAETVVPGRTGYLFSPGDYVELAERLVELQEDPRKRRIMGDEARKRAVTQFSKEFQVEQLAKVFSEG